MPKKSLGQHWLTDQASLEAIVDSANIKPGETVLEIGPGRGALTQKLVASGAKIIAVEKDENLAAKLDIPSVEVIASDILKFDFSSLPPGYKIVANIPYYLTAHLLRILDETENRPQLAVLLMQKEVAERVCAGAGQLSLLAVSVQMFYEPSLGVVVPADKFDPPPKVDSQVLILSPRTSPALGLDSKQFLRLVKAGFSERRKKLRNSLAGGLAIPKEQAEKLLIESGINPDSRAQDLDLEQWSKLCSAWLLAS